MILLAIAPPSDIPAWVFALGLAVCIGMVVALRKVRHD